MESIKGLIRGLMSAGLGLGLISFAIALSLTMVFGNPGAIKQALSSAGVYDSANDSALREAIRDPAGNPSKPPTAVPEQQLIEALRNTFTPAILKDGTEEVIDGVYAWLHGETAEPNFRVDLTGEKQRFIETLANSAAERARQLPACTLTQISELANSPPDPWNLPCMPPGFDIAIIRDRAVTEFANSDEFLKDPIITAEDFPKGSDGRSVFQTASDAPKIFGGLLSAPWVFGFLILLLGGGLWLLHDNKRRALRSIAISLLGSGIMLLIIALILNMVFKQAFPLGDLNGTDPLRQSLNGVLRYLDNAVISKLLWFGTIYAAAGILGLLALHFNNRVKELQNAADTPAAPDPDPSELPPPKNFPRS